MGNWINFIEIHILSIMIFLWVINLGFAWYIYKILDRWKMLMINLTALSFIAAFIRFLYAHENVYIIVPYFLPADLCTWALGFVVILKNYKEFKLEKERKGAIYEISNTVNKINEVFPDKLIENNKEENNL